MNVYKLRVGKCAVREITRENFEKDTLLKFPWYRPDNSGCKRCFAVCPACENPIQILGLYKKLQHTDKPYGRHAPPHQDLSGLPEYSQEAYDYCPYAGPRRYDPNARKPRPDATSRAILELLKSQFDRVCYIIEKAVGIKVTPALARKMLQDYLEAEGHLYRGANLLNVPWIFAYRSGSQSMFGRIIKENEALKNALVQHVEGLSFGNFGQITSTGRYITVNFCFIHHKSEVREDQMCESMRFVVSQPARVADVEHEIIYEQEIIFDHMYFQNLIALGREALNRGSALLAVAEELLAV